jgi:hypothetical protein
MQRWDSLDAVEQEEEEEEEEEPEHFPTPA